MTLVGVSHCDTALVAWWL